CATAKGVSWSAPSALRSYCWPNLRRSPSRCLAASMLERLANAALFQLGWFVCVIGGNSLWLLVALGALVIHLLWISRWVDEGRLILSVVLLGTTVDSSLHWLGVFEFNEIVPLI